MHWLWLTFGDPELERRYRRLTAACDDGLLLLASLGVFVALMWRRTGERGGDSLGDDFTAMVVLATACLFAAGWSMEPFARSPWYTRFRTAWCIACRMFRAIGLARLLGWLISRQTAVDGGLSVVKMLPMRGALLSLLLNRLAFPLPFALGVPAALAEGAALLTLGSSWCGAAGGAADAARWIGAISEVLTSFSDCVLALLHHTARVRLRPLEASCQHVAFFAVVYFGLAVPATLQWLMERSHRRRFLCSLPETDRKNEGVVDGSSANAMGAAIKLVAAAAFLWCLQMEFTAANEEE